MARNVKVLGKMINYKEKESILKQMVKSSMEVGQTILNKSENQLNLKMTINQIKI